MQGSGLRPFATVYPAGMRVIETARAEVVSHNKKTTEVPIKGKINEGEQPYGNQLDYDECLSCQ